MCRFFNGTGPVVKDDHYCVEPLERADLPWLVNVLAYDACFEIEAQRNRSRPIEAETIRAPTWTLRFRRLKSGW